MLLPEFVEMLCALSNAGARYLVVGGHAVGVHVEPRATKDLDIWVEPTLANARRVVKALRAFGAPLFGVTVKELSTPGLIFQIGVAPRRIDILTAISGVDFRSAWRSRFEIKIRGLPAMMPVIGREALLTNKRAVARPQDLVDALNLESGVKRRRRS